MTGLAQTAARFELRLLGEFQLLHDGEPRPLIYEKSRALLAWLALESGRSHARETLAELFWPELARGAALTNLRQVLGDLRSTFATGTDTPPLRIGRETVGLDPAPNMRIDAHESLAPDADCPSASNDAGCRSCLAAMQAHADRLNAGLLSGLRLPECDEFTRWLQARRETVRRRWLGRQLRLADCRAARGDVESALRSARAVLDVEPAHEGALRRTIELLVAGGETAIAIKEYERFAARLRREYGLEPAVETRALIERPRADRPTGTIAIGETAPVLRRQVGTLACEFVLRDAATNAVDEDDATEMLWRHLAEAERIAREIFDRHGAKTTQARGGSLIAYFGHSGGSENSVLTAITAALEIRRHIAVDAPTVGVRFGAHVGTVLCDDSLLPDPAGLVSGVAVALRQRAETGECLVSAEGWARVAGYYATTAIPTHAGTTQLGPTIHRIDAPSGAATRIEAVGARGALLPLCGRERELSALTGMWHALVDADKTGAVLLRGEPGIGKSRLALALGQMVRNDAREEKRPRIHELHCSAERANTPFHPFADWLATPDHAADGDSPERRRERLFARLLHTFAGDRDGRPALLLIEDLQWADPSTLEFVDRALRIDGPCLLCLTARPEFAAPWPRHAYREIVVNHLPEPDVVALVAAALPPGGETAVPADLVRLIVERADGVPLFAEELARSLPSRRAATLPETLIELLTARIDAAGDARVVLDVASAIGREFDLSLLRRCLPIALDAVAFERALARLAELRLIELPVAPKQTPEHALHLGRFCHALVRDAVHRAQTNGCRVETHRRIADELRRTDALPELLARHRAASGEPAAALAAWLRAGRMAARQAACHEAIAHFRSGLALLSRLADTRERATRELELSIGLGAAACAADGYASTEGAAAYARAMALCNAREVDTCDETFAAIWGLWTSASSRVGYDGAWELAQQLLRMAARSDDPVLVQQAHFAVGNTAYWRGDFAIALHHLERVESIWRPAHHNRHVQLFGEDAGVTSAAYRAWILHPLGRTEAARAAADLAVARARDLGHPVSEAYALAFAASLHCRLREYRQAAALAARTLTLAERHGFAMWRLVALVVQGWSRAMQGDVDGVAIVRNCVDGMRAAMGGVTVAVLVPLAEAVLESRRHAEARAIVDETVALAKQLGDGHALAELALLDGIARWQLGDQRGAEAAFRRGRAYSRRQNTPMRELRLLLAQCACHDQRIPTASVARRLSTLTEELSAEESPELAAALALLKYDTAATPRKI